MDNTTPPIIPTPDRRLYCRICRKVLKSQRPEENTPLAAAMSAVLMNALVCDDCYEAHEAERAREQQAALQVKFKSLCPPLYHDTDRQHPSMPRRESLQRIVDWKYGPRGLMIHGPTQRCKSRCAWLLLQRLFVEGRSVVATTAGRFAVECANASFNGPESAIEWFEKNTRASVLFIDDLGKCKLTERVEADLFEVIDWRVTHLKPIIFTTNLTGEDLSQMMTPDRGEPLVRRLREFCEDVAL